MIAIAAPGEEPSEGLEHRGAVIGAGVVVDSVARRLEELAANPCLSADQASELRRIGRSCRDVAARLFEKAEA